MSNPHSKAARVAGTMNGTERSYSLHLDALKQSGKIRAWFFESVKLGLGKNCFYTPDFMVIRSDDVVEFHEVKGFWRDDARVKIKVAADKYPFIFVAVQLKGGQWITEQFTKEEK
ncbi:MAG: hypothetical protein LUE08_07315 [Akkermansiaceae bacterium]|nr:hypothetical protein [Akkermansiaceae bacterium]